MLSGAPPCCPVMEFRALVLQFKFPSPTVIGFQVVQVSVCMPLVAVSFNYAGEAVERVVHGGPGEVLGFVETTGGVGGGRRTLVSSAHLEPYHFDAVVKAVSPRLASRHGRRVIDLDITVRPVGTCLAITEAVLVLAPHARRGDS